MWCYFVPHDKWRDDICWDCWLNIPGVFEWFQEHEHQIIRDEGEHNAMYTVRASKD